MDILATVALLHVNLAAHVSGDATATVAGGVFAVAVEAAAVPASKPVIKVLAMADDRRPVRMLSLIAAD